MACAGKQQAKLTGSCVGDSKYAQVKITIEHDNAGVPSDILDVPPVTIYMKPDPSIPSQKGRVCWVIEPTDANGLLPKLSKSLYLKSHNGTALFGTWTTKKKMPSDGLELASGLPNGKNPGWKYDLKCGGVDVDPVIIVIDESH